MDKNLTLSNPIVSIIMPAFNAEEFIQEAINSVIAQTYLNWELIIIDDGSTDNTKNICNLNIVKDKRIKYLHKFNSGPASARNFGITYSNAGLIAFLDADDLWHPKKLEITLFHFYRLNVDLIFTNTYLFSKREELLHIDQLATSSVQDKNSYFGTEAIIDFFESNRIPVLTVLVKKSVILSVAAFATNKEYIFIEDFHLWLKLLKSGFEFASISEPLSFYRIHSQSSSNTDKSISLKVVCAITEISKDDINLLNKSKIIIRKWLKYWVKNSLNRTNINEFEKTLGFVEIYGFIFKILFKYQKYVPLNLLKTIFVKALV